MKHRLLWLFFSCAALAVSLGVGTLERAQTAAPMPEPSAPGGYYQNAFTLTLSAPQAGTIHYTTDGSIPTESSQVYQGGIPIADRSGEPNRYRSVQNIVPDWLNYHPDETPVEKGTVVRAVYISPRGLCSDVMTQTYFVGVQPPQGYALCLSFPPEQLFGAEGIYVTGADYDNWYRGGKQGEAPECNYQKNTEIAAGVELIYGQELILNQVAALRIQGASTRKRPVKNLMLTARTELGGAEVFDTPLFGGVLTHSLMLKDALPDAMMGQLFSDRAVALQESIPVRIYFNGEYWCDSFALERYDSQYFRQHYDVDDRILVKNKSTNADSKAAGYGQLYAEFMDWVSTTDFSDPREYAALEQEMDIQSYIDYIAINYYLCNWDMSEEKNYVLWRSPAQGRSGYNDGRWRWCLYDIDILLAAPYNENTPFPASVNIFRNTFSKSRLPISQSRLFTALRRSPEFNRRFTLSFMDIVNQNFSKANMQRVLERYGETLEWMDGYFLDRPAYAAKHLAEELKLTGTLETVTVTTADPNMGTVQVNTSVIDLRGGSWSGQYFTDYPITLTAIPADGYQFSCWKGVSNETAPTVTVPMARDMALEAVFEKST